MNHRERALRSLDGLSVGDAFGERVAAEGTHLIMQRQPPQGPWPWTDDTHMALSVVETLIAEEGIDPDALVQRFVERYRRQPHRGYGRGAHRLLTNIENGASWRDEATALFNGSGSYGNGAAMRAAPIGAYFARHPARAADEARTSAGTTHTHPEGASGAIAVAVAASVRFGGDRPAGPEFIEEVLRFTPRGETYDRLNEARSIQPFDLGGAIHNLGTGHDVAAYDTVPFCLWIVANHGENFAEALWKTVSGGGDADTTCAIVGGILGGAGVAIPPVWRERREALPPHLALDVIA